MLPGDVHVAGTVAHQRLERDHHHLKGRVRPMRGGKKRRCAQIIGAGQDFLRHLGQGCYRLGIVLGDPRMPRPPRLVRAWEELPTVLQAV